MDYGRNGLPRGCSSKEFTCQSRRRNRRQHQVGKIPWRRKWQPAPVFFPGKFHGQGSLVGYSPWDCRRVGHDLATGQRRPSTVPGTEHVLSTRAWTEGTERRRGAGPGLCSQQSLVLIPAMPLPGCVTWGPSLKVSELQVPHM